MNAFLLKHGVRPIFLVLLLLSTFMLLPLAAHAQSLPYPLETNLNLNWLCYNRADHLPACTPDQFANTQMVGEFTITNTSGSTAEGYTLGNGTVGYVGSSIIASPGEPLTLSWSFDLALTQLDWKCTNEVLGVCVGYGFIPVVTNTFYNYGISSNFGQSSQYGTTVIAAPSSGSATYTIGGIFGNVTYTTYTKPSLCMTEDESGMCISWGCPVFIYGSGWTLVGDQYSSSSYCEKTVAIQPTTVVNLSLTVNVSGTAPPPMPTASLTPASETIAVGQPVTFNLSATAGTGDSITNTAITESTDGGADQTPVVSGSATSQTYSFTPTAAGTYDFYGLVTTAHYAASNPSGAHTTLTVNNPLCSAASNGGATGTWPNCVCNNGGTYTSSTNSCGNPPPASCTFNGNTIPSGNSVTAYQTPLVTFPATCQSQIRTCTDGTLSGSYAYPSCSVTIPAGSISSFTATPSRVHPGGSTTLTWSTANMASCTVTSSDTPPQTLSTALNSTGLLVQNITHVEVYTLSCLDNNSAPFVSQVKVSLVPVYQEL